MIVRHSVVTCTGLHLCIRVDVALRRHSGCLGRGCALWQDQGVPKMLLSFESVMRQLFCRNGIREALLPLIFFRTWPEPWTSFPFARNKALESAHHPKVITVKFPPGLKESSWPRPCNRCLGSQSSKSSNRWLGLLEDGSVVQAQLASSLGFT